LVKSIRQLHAVSKIVKFVSKVVSKTASKTVSKTVIRQPQNDLPFVVSKIVNFISMSTFNGIFLPIFYRRNVHESPLVLPSRAFGLWQKALRST
jgi:hypothetical protein